MCVCVCVVVQCVKRRQVSGVRSACWEFSGSCPQLTSDCFTPPQVDEHRCEPSETTTCLTDSELLTSFGRFDDQRREKKQFPLKLLNPWTWSVGLQQTNRSDWSLPAGQTCVQTLICCWSSQSVLAGFYWLPVGCSAADVLGGPVWETNVWLSAKLQPGFIIFVYEDDSN